MFNVDADRNSTASPRFKTKHQHERATGNKDETKRRTGGKKRMEREKEKKGMGSRWRPRILPRGVEEEEERDKEEEREEE